MDCPGEEEGVRSWLPQLYSELGERLKEHKAWVEQVVTCDSGILLGYWLVKSPGAQLQKGGFQIRILVQQQSPTGYNCPPFQLMKGSYKLSL